VSHVALHVHYLVYANVADNEKRREEKRREEKRREETVLFIEI
jgi:hypothetical protein